MSTKQKRKAKAKPKAPNKERLKPTKRRKTEERKKPEKKEVTQPKEVAKVVVAPPEKPLFLAVRLLGQFGAPTNIENALTRLRLTSRFRAVLLEKNGSMLGTLRKVKDYVAWGEVKSKDIAVLLKERGELSNGMEFNEKFVREELGHESIEEVAQAITSGQIPLKLLWEKGVSPVFRLRPPSGGFEGSIKRPFGSQGELGNRGGEISSLVIRMI